MVRYYAFSLLYIIYRIRFYRFIKTILSHAYPNGILKKVYIYIYILQLLKMQHL